MKYKIALHISGAVFYIEIEIDNETDPDYVGNHIASAMNASFLYATIIEEQP